MIPQHGDHVVASVIKPAQGLEIIGAAVNEVADAPDNVLIGIEIDTLQQLLKRLETALYVSHYIGRHGFLVCVSA